jgi:hypothetical protein
MFLFTLVMGYVVYRLEWNSSLLAERNIPVHAVFLLVCFSVVLLFVGFSQ